MEFYGCENENFQMKKCDIFLISAQNIDCGYSLEPPRDLCFRAETRKIMHTLANPTFSFLKWGLRGSKLYRHVFMMNKFYCLHSKLKNLYLYIERISNCVSLI